MHSCTAPSHTHRGRKGEIGVAPPLLTVSSSQARNILAERAEQILVSAEVIPWLVCTVQLSHE